MVYMCVVCGIVMVELEEMEENNYPLAGTKEFLQDKQNSPICGQWYFYGCKRSFFLSFRIAGLFFFQVAKHG